MSAGTIATFMFAGYVATSIGYVYRWRGRMRYPGLSQYLRKSWPIFAPFNCLLYMATKAFARKPVLDADYLQGISLIRDHWRVIRDEALALHRAGDLEATAVPGSAGYSDIGFRTFYKRGWRKFYLKWYGEPHRSAQRLCPETVRLVEQVPGIRAAMFSLLPAGSELSLHSDPLACSLRYHLGLETPNATSCFICVDGRRLHWRDGEDFVFDETYPHYARNDSDLPRLIFMCDVERPMSGLGRIFNRVYSKLVSAMAVPNTPEDRRGAMTALFARLAPLQAASVAMKARNRKTYVMLKVSLNMALVSAAFLLLYGVIDLLASAGNRVMS